MKLLPIFFLLILAFNLVLVSAVDTTNDVGKGFNFKNFFSHTFSIQQFSIIGEDRGCSVNPAKTNTYAKNALMSVSSSTAGCSNSLIDVFDGVWNEIGEWKDTFSMYCGDADGCIVEIYCCPHAECTSNSQCVTWNGAGSTCVSKTANDPYINYYDSSYNLIPTYKTCSNSCTGSAITCWRVMSGVCESRSYDCSYETYPNCPTTYPYTTQSACDGSINPTCATSGQSCGYSSTAPTCCSGLDCQNFQCVTTGTCTSGSTKCEGTISYNCISGTWISQGQVNGQCGYTLPVSKGDIRMESGKSWTTTSSLTSKDVTFQIPLKNYGDKSETIYLEAGFYSNDYAHNTAKLFSMFNLFSAVSVTSCNPYENFTQTKQVTLAPGATEIVSIKVNPRTAFSTYGAGTHSMVSEPLVSFFGLYKQCLGGYINEAGTTGKGVMFDYKTFAEGCPLFINVNVYCGTKKIGTCMGTTLTLNEGCSIPLTTTVVATNEADTNQDGVISRDELGVAINKWINGQMSRETLGNVIQIWATN